MALLGRQIASFAGAAPVPSLDPLDDEFNQLTGANGALNGGSTSNRVLTKYSHATEPVQELDQLGAGLIAQFKQNGVQKAAIANSGAFQTASTTLVANLNADLLDGLEGSEYAVLATHKTAFSVSFGIADPSTPTVGAVIPGTVAWVCPAGASITVTKVSVVFQSGSHTSGGSISFQLQKRTAASSWTSITNFGTSTLDNSQDDQFVVYTADISDEPLAEGDTLIMFISARTGTITERDITVSARGTQKLTT